MIQTTYYGFNKPEGTDLVNPLVDTNPNWDALDADLHEFNERSISNASEVVALGVHTISRLDTTAKFLKWIATANFTSGETFTVDGLPVAATTPAGAALATNAYVTGSIVLACLNADNTAMTIYVSGTTVATDSERLGGKLPSYYGTASDVSDNATDITNLQNQMGNTSIVGIGDGTATGAIDALNTAISNLGNLLEWTSVWTNANPTSNFNPQDVLVDLTNVNEICILVKSSTSGGGSPVSNILPINVSAYNVITTSERSRSVTIDTVNNKLTFGAGYSGSSPANNCAIPIEILVR